MVATTANNNDDDAAARRESGRKKSVRRRSIVIDESGASRVENRRVSSRIVSATAAETLGNDLHKAIQTPLSDCVSLLGSIMLMEDLPSIVTEKVEQVLNILGKPEVLFQTDLGTKDGQKKAGMDDATKLWYVSDEPHEERTENL